MLWQDILITTASFVFSLALFPQIYYGFKEKKGHITYATSVPTFIGLYAICIAYFSLHLVLSTIVCFITGTLWFILFIQRWMYNKTEILKIKKN